MSLSPQKPATRPMPCRPSSFRTRASAVAASGLCAPSMTYVAPSFVTRWQRPGQTTCARPSAIAASDSANPSPFKTSSVAFTVAAFSSWNAPKSAKPCGGFHGMAQTSGAPWHAATARMASSASDGIAPQTTGRSGLTMPAFSAAMAACVVPSQSQWSRPMRVITLTSGEAMTFVASSRPPSPVSRTVTSGLHLAKRTNATAVSASKKVTSSPCSRSRRAMTANTSSATGPSVSSETGAPSRKNRSLRATRCGDV